MKKGLKSIVGILMLVAVTAAFFGVPFAGLACKVQPGVSWTFLAVLLLTPVFGRLFCECLCPLGFLQTLVNRLSHPKHHVRRVCTRLPETKTQRVVRSKKFIFGLVLVLILGFGVGAFLSFGKFWSTNEVVVPDVVGKQMTLARQILEDKKLRVNVAETYSADVPPGQVVSQTPEAGSKVKEERLVTIYVSKGGEELTMPDLQASSFPRSAVPPRQNVRFPISTTPLH